MGFDSAISGLSATQAPLATCTKKRLRYREVCACRYNNYRTAIYLKNGARISGSGLDFPLLEKGFGTKLTARGKERKAVPLPFGARIVIVPL